MTTKMPTKDPNPIVDETVKTNGKWTKMLIKSKKRKFQTY